MYRHVDFYRKKFDMPAVIERIEYDPNRSCHIMLVKFEDNSHAYYLAPQKIKVGDKIEKSIRNIPNIKVTDINHFSAFDIIKFKKIVFTESSVKELEKRYA